MSPFFGIRTVPNGANKLEQFDTVLTRSQLNSYLVGEDVDVPASSEAVHQVADLSGQAEQVGTIRQVFPCPQRDGDQVFG